MTFPPLYFSNAIVTRHHAAERATVLCGCGCGNEGIITYRAAVEMARRYGDDLRGSLLTLDGHGPGVHTGRGILWLAPAPPVVLYVDHERIEARDLVASANAALRSMTRGGAST